MGAVEKRKSAQVGAHILRHAPHPLRQTQFPRKFCGERSDVSTQNSYRTPLGTPCLPLLTCLSLYRAAGRWAVMVSGFVFGATLR